MKDWPYKYHPTGWFMIGWSWTVAPGEVKALHIFDEDVVLYRTEEGVAKVIDAHCPHLGAHIGVGGCVKGETIQCPFHGWRFDTEGKNVEIPFSDSINRSVRVKHWHVCEKDHLILVWYDGLGREPSWEWPGIPEFRDPDYHQPHEYEGAAICYGERLKVIPQMPLENAADSIHFAFVHGAGSPAVQEVFETEGHELRIKFRILFGEGKKSTWATPDGEQHGHIDGQRWGMGLGVARFEVGGLKAAQVNATTPVDRDHSMAFATMASLRAPGSTELTGPVKRVIDEQIKQVRRDFHIWENQKYLQRPSFVMPQERNYAALRRWSKQFYPDAEEVEMASADTAPNGTQP